MLVGASDVPPSIACRARGIARLRRPLHMPRVAQSPTMAASPRVIE